MTTLNTIIADMHAEIDALRKERDEFLETIEIMIIGACAVGVPHQGERQVLRDAVEHARCVINKAKSSVKC